MPPHPACLPSKSKFRSGPRPSPQLLKVATVLLAAGGKPLAANDAGETPLSLAEAAAAQAEAHPQLSELVDLLRAAEGVQAGAAAGRSSAGKRAPQGYARHLIRRLRLLQWPWPACLAAYLALGEVVRWL